MKIMVNGIECDDLVLRKERNIISIYELLGLVKGGKAPKRIHAYVYNWVYDNNKDYINDFETKLFEDYLENVISTSLNDEVEILDEEDEFIDIDELDIEYDNDGRLSRLLNDLIKNQKKIIEKLEKEGKIKFILG